MKNAEYKAFKDTVNTADEKHFIWWAGYLWIDLTKRQAREIVNILSGKDFIKKTTTFNGHEALEIPSGLAIWTEQ